MKKEVFEKFPELETKRVRIREMNENDVNVVYNFNSDEAALEYIVREPFKTIKEGQVKLESFLSQNKDKSAFWWVFEIKESGEQIGYGGIFDISTAHSRAEIGYGLIQKYWNKGYMSEIITEVLKFAQSQAGFHKIYGVIIPGNNASIKLLENNGFEKEAHLKSHSFGRGKYFDETIYSKIF